LFITLCYQTSFVSVDGAIYLPLDLVDPFTTRGSSKVAPTNGAVSVYLGLADALPQTCNGRCGEVSAGTSSGAPGVDDPETKISPHGSEVVASEGL
jgi:hypothetical protein